MASNPVTKVTEEQYLAMDRAAEVHSEFLDGQMWAMSGGSWSHLTLQANIVGDLVSALRGTDCRALTSDLHLRVVPGRVYSYPDVAVVCGKPRFADDRHDVLLNPTVVFEVLSPSTESYDRGAKLQNYLRIESLKDYILVEQDKIHAEHYSRELVGAWTFRVYDRLEENLKLDSIGVSLPLARIYDRVELPPAA
jgi:Uma2 family endonuclease